MTNQTILRCLSILAINITLSLCANAQFKEASLFKEEDIEIELAFPSILLPDDQTTFKDSFELLVELINNNLVYPQAAIDDYASGVTALVLTFNRHGQLVEKEIIRPIHPAVNKELERVISLIPDFRVINPSAMPVSIRFAIPIRLTLRM